MDMGMGKGYDITQPMQAAEQNERLSERLVRRVQQTEKESAVLRDAAFRVGQDYLGHAEPQDPENRESPQNLDEIMADTLERIERNISSAYTVLEAL